jgi:hydrogenase maturation protease
MADVRIIGLGNPMAGDDAVGVLAARRLAAVSDLPAEVVEAGLAGIDVLELVRDSRAVILIDAVRSGQPAGAIHRLDASTGSLTSASWHRSTHGFNAADALELARALDALPPTVVVYGVEAGAVEAGAPLSPKVAAALPALVDRIRQEAAALAGAIST